MHRAKQIALILVVLAIGILAMLNLSQWTSRSVQAVSVPAADAGSSTVRVKLSAGVVSEIRLTLSGTYSIASGALIPGDYIVKNSGGSLILQNTAGDIFARSSESIMIMENQNPDPSTYNKFSMLAEGVRRNYLGGIKFWVDGTNIIAVNHVFLEKYLYGVVAYEMSNSFPLDALKAQAVAARCYALKKLEGSRSARYDIVDTSSDQVYKGYDPTVLQVIRAVDETRGMVLLSGRALITAFYSASNGGQTERSENVWTSALSYLKIQDDPYDAANPSSKKQTIYFPTGTTLDKNEDKPVADIQPIGLGVIRASTSFYSQADTGSTKLSALAANNNVLILEVKDTWVRIKIGEQVGFVTASAVNAYAFDAAIASANWRFRKEATTSSEILLVFPVQAKVKLLAYVADWFKVDYDGTVGWVWRTALSLTKLNGGTTPPAPEAGTSQNSIGLGIITGITQAGLYTEANTNSKIKDLASGTRVMIYDRNTTWTKVVIGDQTGYVMTKYVTGYSLTATVSTSGWRFRSQAATTSSIILTFPSSAKVTILGYAANFYQVSYGGKTGYVWYTALTLTKLPAPTSAGSSGNEQSSTLTGCGVISGISKTGLYSSASSTSSKIKDLALGACFMIYERNSAWTRVKIGDQTGYIMTQYTTAYSLAATVASSGWRFRAQASTTSSIILTFPALAKVTIVDVLPDWYKVSYSGKTGYVWNSALTLAKLPAPPAVTTSSATTSAAMSAATQTMTMKTASTLSTQSVDNNAPVQYSDDLMDARLVDFLKTLAVAQIVKVNAGLPSGEKYKIDKSLIAIKLIVSMTGIQTSSRPYCMHHPESTLTGPHDASTCPSIDFTGVKMTILLKVSLEDAGKVGGINRVDYAMDLQFTIQDYLKSGQYTQWQLFDPGNGLRIFSIQHGTTSGGYDAFLLVNTRFGHGVGLSQRGAQQRAKDADPAISQYQNILAFYYPGTTLSDTGLAEQPLPAPPSNLAWPINKPTPTPVPTETTTATITQPTTSETTSPTTTSTTTGSETTAPSGTTTAATTSATTSATTAATTAATTTGTTAGTTAATTTAATTAATTTGATAGTTTAATTTSTTVATTA